MRCNEFVYPFRLLAFIDHNPEVLEHLVRRRVIPGLTGGLLPVEKVFGHYLAGSLV